MMNMKVKILIIGLIISACSTFSGPKYSGPISSNFDGKQFINQDSSESRGFWDFIWWRLFKEDGLWLKDFTDIYGSKPFDFVPDDSLRVTFINHSTVLLQYDSLNILTDPVWSDIVSPVFFIGPERHRNPGIKFEDLPKIHVVLLSHNHYDHWDYPTIMALNEVHKPLFVVSLGNKPLMESYGISNCVELDWWQDFQNSSFKVTAVPARHFANRGLDDRNTTLWIGYVLHTRGGPVFFAGDTGWGKHFEQISQKFAPMRFSMIPIGAYKPRWFMDPVHTSPKEAVMAHKLVKSKFTMGIHFGTFKQADDSQDDPVNDLIKEREKDSELSNFVVFRHGRPVWIPKLNP